MFDLLEFLAQLFVFIVGVGILIVAGLYVVDRAPNPPHDPKLQRGLDPVDKAERVPRYALAINNEVGVIAHSCGVPELRRLKRFHCRIVQDDGKSIPLDELYPDQKPRMALQRGAA